MNKDELELNDKEGAFFDSLRRNNKQIKEDRAAEISESAQIKYKRKIEDLEQDIKNMKRSRRSMLDLSPTDAQSLILASDFKADEFVSKDIELGVKIRNLEIQLEIAKDRYSYLFTNKSQKGGE